MDFSESAAQLRAAERQASEELARGCAEDLAAIARLLAAPLREARIELEEQLLSLGALDSFLHRNVLIESAEEIALRCASNAFANAAVRFRARFGIYASALAEAQERFLITAREVISDGERDLHARRRLTLPRIEIDDGMELVPRICLTTDSIERWIHELDLRLRHAMECTVEKARQSVVRRGAVSMSRVRVALRLAAHGHHVTM